MKICHEVNQLDFGGVERVVRNLIKFDKKNEHSIITYRDGAFRPELEKVGAKIVILPDDTHTVDMEADIIHVHTGGADSQLARKLGQHFPVIETIHSPVRSVIPNEIIRQRVGVSEAVARMNNNCIAIHNGLDIDELECSNTASANAIRHELGINENEIVVGRLGRIGRDKGLEEWLLVCYALQQQGLKFHPVIVGGASEQDKNYMGKLKLMATSLPVNGVIWVGHKVDIMNYLQIMDIFMYPSPTEGFGLVFAEAILAGCAVAAWRTDVTHELFGGYAVLTEPTIKDLVKGVEKLFSVDYRDSFSGISQDWVKSQYNAQDMSRQYQDLYERSI